MLLDSEWKFNVVGVYNYKKSGKLEGYFDFIKKNVWAYSFHPDTIVLDKVKKIYIAANDKYGNTTIKNLKIN